MWGRVALAVATERLDALVYLSRKEIEAKLQEINPNYFDYFAIDEAFAKLKN